MAVVGGTSTVIATSSKTFPQAPPVMVHRNALYPAESPFTAVVASAALVNVPEPLTTDQLPPVAAVAARIVDVAQMC